VNSYTFTRRTVPHLRCGLCQGEFATGDPTRYVDDERCHVDCANGDQSNVVDTPDLDEATP
jgi:hypothetical protein